MSEPTPDVTTTDLLGQEHEQVVFCRDEASGLRAIVALHSTALGPGLGGTRFFPYRSESEALADVLDLSRGMTYKNALAGLDHGGGKAVIWGDPGTDKSEALLRAYGRFVESLGGRYVTACDVGTYSPDMDVVARESRHVTGRTEAEGGAGDSSRLTAFGVHQGLRAAAAFRWGSDSLAGRTVGISGVGKVGRLLTGLLLDDDADVVVTDVDAAALADVQDRHPGVRVARSTAELVAEPLDVYAPCALGHALTDDVVRSIAGAVVGGGANNQLAHGGTAGLLAEADVLYAPDFCVNAGVIQVADELHPAGPDFGRARARAAGIFETTLTVLELAASEGTTTASAAERLAERRITDVGGLQRMWL